MKFFRSIGPIEGLTFDLDDTLYDNHPLMIVAEQRLLDYLARHYPDTQDMTVHHWRAIKNEQLQIHADLASDMGELRKRTLRAGLTTRGYSGQTLNNAVQDCFEFFYFERSNFEISKTIHSLLSELSKRLPLVAITNGNVNMQQVGLDGYFTHCFKANLANPMKPHPHMFELASSKLNIKPGRLLHVGDNFEKDVQGAIAAGYQSAWFACNRPMQLNRQRINVLPHIQLDRLEELLELVL